MTSYLGRNVNLALLIIIIGVVVALVGTTVFFQRGLQNRTEAYQDTSQGLQQCQVALSNYQQKFSKAQAEVNATAQDIRRYDQLYEQKVGELQDSQNQLASTQTQLEFEKLQKAKFQQFYESASRQNAALNSTIASLNKQVDSLENKVDDLRKQLAECN